MPIHLAAAAGVFSATFVAQVALHELAHAIAGWAVGLRIVQVELGRGRLLTRRRFAGVTWRLHLIPSDGATVAVPKPAARFVRLRLWLFTLAGPLLDLALVALLAGATVRLERSGGPAWLAFAAALACAIRAVTSLFPSPARSAAGLPAGSDGWQLLAIPFLSAKQIATLRATGAAVTDAADVVAEPPQAKT